MIFRNTPPDVAAARIRAWQRQKELAFFAELERLVTRAANKGLEKKRMARALGMLTKALEKVGGSP
jgi:hypothetical protein